MCIPIRSGCRRTTATPAEDGREHCVPGPVHLSAARPSEVHRHVERHVDVVGEQVERHMREDLDDLLIIEASRAQRCTSPSAICARCSTTFNAKSSAAAVAGSLDWPICAAAICSLLAPALRPNAVCAARQYSQALRLAMATAICSPSSGDRRPPPSAPNEPHMLCRAAGELATARNMAGVAPKAAWTWPSRAWRSAVVLAASIRGHGTWWISLGKRPGLDDPLILGRLLDATSSMRHICCPYVHEHARRHPCARSTLLPAGTLPGAGGPVPQWPAVRAACLRAAARSCVPAHPAPG